MSLAVDGSGARGRGHATRRLGRVVRSLGGVVLGYAAFAFSAGLLFAVAHRAPHAPAPLGFMILTIAYGALFGAVGGYVAGLVAGRRPLAHAAAVALLILAGALSSLVAEVAARGRGAEPAALWSQVAALVVMAPAALVGGWVRHRRCAAAAHSTPGS